MTEEKYRMPQILAWGALLVVLATVVGIAMWPDVSQLHANPGSAGIGKSGLPPTSAC